MASISVDYKDMASRAKTIRALGQSINSELNRAYQSISMMRSNWNGIRYNELIKVCNEAIPQINNLLTLVVGELPYAIETVAKNYEKADTGANVISATNTAPVKIEQLTTTDVVGMKCITSKVEEVKDAVSTNFDKAEENMNALETEFTNITWEGDAATAFATQLKTLKVNVIAALDFINTQFTSQMIQAVADIQAAETANTVTDASTTGTENA